MSGSLAAPQDGHISSRGAAHLPQNFRPGLFSDPQLGQII
jgi:hypothetical protein